MANYDKTSPPEADEINGKWKHLVKHCLDLYDRFQKSNYRKKKIEEIKESNDAYEQIEKQGTDPWEGAHNLSLPLVTISSDNLEPRLWAGLVGKYPYVHLEMENEQEQDESAEVIETFFNQELQDNVGAEGLATSIVNIVQSEGTVYCLPYYDMEEETHTDFLYFDEATKDLMPQIQAGQQQLQQYKLAAAQLQNSGNEIPQDLIDANTQTQSELKGLLSQIPEQLNGIVIDPKTGDPITQEKKTKVFEGGRVEIIPFTDVFTADNVDDWEKATVIRKLYPTYSELLSDAQKKKGFIKNAIGPWLCDEESEEVSQDQVSPSQEQEGIKEFGAQTIELLEISITYVYQDIDKDKKDQKNYDPERYLLWIEPRNKILLRRIKLREINFKNQHLIKRLRLFPRKGKSYGTSLYGKLKSIQKGVNKVFNTSLNIAEILMIPWFMFDYSSGMERYVAEDGNKLKPGMGIKCDNVNGIKFPSFGSINPQSMVQWLDIFMMFWERLLSIGDLQVGRQGSKDTTATETMAVIQEGNVKHNYQSSTLKDDFLAIIRTLFDLYYQHMPLDKQFLWNGKMTPIDRRAMNRGYKFRLTGSTDLSNKLIERKEKETFYQLTAQDPNINPVKKSEELVKAYGHTDTNEWISPGIGAIVAKIVGSPALKQGVEQFIAQAEAQMQEVAGNQKGQI